MQIYFWLLSFLKAMVKDKGHNINQVQASVTNSA